MAKINTDGLFSLFSYSVKFSHSVVFYEFLQLFILSTILSTVGKLM